MEAYNSKLRKPAVAGKFYPSDVKQLEAEVKEFLRNSDSKQLGEISGLISPHAGYVFSGRTAATAFAQLNPESIFENIFIIGSSHHHHFGKAAVYSEGDWEMPYGKESVNADIGNELANKYPEIFTDNPLYHKEEHSLEVQLPFLHYRLKNPYKIVPIIIGCSDTGVCRSIALALKPYMTAKNLFVVSTDLSHYPAYDDAKKADKNTINAILTGNPEKLVMALNGNTRQHIPGLATSLCGWTSVLTFMMMTEEIGGFEYHLIDACNSGDAKYYGKKDSVVGYCSTAITRNENTKSEFNLNDHEKKLLLGIARKTLENYFAHTKTEVINKNELTNNLKAYCGAFVTLHIDGRLRGCIGRMTGNVLLYELVSEMAISAAFHDRRFSPLQSSELQRVKIEISVLSPMKKIDDISEIELGKHGILIENGYRSGVFLPQVATETGWTLEEYLGHCARDKAGLGWEGWRNANIYVFTAEVFSE
jgi:AmmeMemoRadiSam system protein B/AmmeMemoRadiSam system protein A